VILELIGESGLGVGIPHGCRDVSAVIIS